MNPILLTIIFVPIIEIYLLIKIGSQIGAMSTILLIFVTAIIGIYYAKYEGLNTLKSGLAQLSKNETPAYEVISGAAIAFAADTFISSFIVFALTSKAPLKIYGKPIKLFTWFG